MVIHINKATELLTDASGMWLAVSRFGYECRGVDKMRQGTISVHMRESSHMAWHELVRHWVDHDHGFLTEI